MKKKENNKGDYRTVCDNGITYATNSMNI